MAKQRTIADLKIGEYRSVGGSSTHVLFNFPGYGALYMGSIETISYSTYRDKVPVYNLGNTNIDGFALGKRYVAGSIVKTLFVNDDFTQFVLKIKEDIGLDEDIDSLYSLKNDSYKTYHHMLMDDVMPFDIIIVMTSEYGNWAVAEVIYGATLINTGQIQSINDMVVQSTISFVANDVKMTHEQIGQQNFNIGSPKGILRGTDLTTGRETVKSPTNINTINYSSYTKEEIEELIKSGVLPASALEDWAAINKTTVASESVKTNYEDSNKVVSKTENNGTTVFVTNQIDPYNFYSSNMKVDMVKTKPHDGDTITLKTVKNNGGETINDLSIRLVLIDTPEVGGAGEVSQPFGIEARDFLANYVASGQWDRDVSNGLVTKTGVDVYGRVLAKNSAYAEAIVRAGLAWPMASEANASSGYTSKEISALNKAYLDAKENNRGLWGSESYPIQPSRWRKMTEQERKENGGV